MNTPVSFETKNILFNKGWRYKLSLDETGRRVENSLAEQRWNEGDLTYIDITITEVIMWLYEKHGIWISVLQHTKNSEGKYFEAFVNSMTFSGYNSPTEAYEVAIEYTLKNLIK